MRNSTERRAAHSRVTRHPRVARLQSERTVVSKKERASLLPPSSPTKIGFCPAHCRSTESWLAAVPTCCAPSRSSWVVVTDLWSLEETTAGKSWRVGSTGRAGAIVGIGLGRCRRNWWRAGGALEPDDLGPRAHRRLNPHYRRRTPCSVFGSVGVPPARSHTSCPCAFHGGERARTLAMLAAAGHANVLVLDEPTNNRDPDRVGSRRCDATCVARNSCRGEPRPPPGHRGARADALLAVPLGAIQLVSGTRIWRRPSSVDG